MMFKRSLAVLVAATVCVLAAAPSASTAKPVGVCPPPFQALTFEQAIELGIELGAPLTPEEIEAILTSLDTNRDEILCFLDLPNTPGIPPFAFNVIDNTASVPE
jgi:hypothetical protein